MSATGLGGTTFLLSKADPIGRVEPRTELESKEIRALLNKSMLSRPSSAELGWKNFAIERRTSLPSEKPEVTLQHHFLILWDVHVAEGEIAYRGGRFLPYKKYPNTITTCPRSSWRATAFFFCSSVCSCNP